MRKNCPHLDLFWSAFSHMQTEYGDILHISSSSVQMRENGGQKNFKYRDFLRSICSYVLACHLVQSPSTKFLLINKHIVFRWFYTRLNDSRMLRRHRFFFSAHANAQKGFLTDTLLKCRSRFLDNGLGIVSPAYFVYDFLINIFLVLYSIKWPNVIACLPLLLEILVNMCIAIIC